MGNGGPSEGLLVGHTEQMKSRASLPVWTLPEVRIIKHIKASVRLLEKKSTRSFWNLHVVFRDPRDRFTRLLLRLERGKFCRKTRMIFSEALGNNREGSLARLIIGTFVCIPEFMLHTDPAAC